MIFIFFSICCSVFVSVLLKLAKRYKIDVIQAIAWNYLAAGFLCYIIYRPPLITLYQASNPFHIYLLLGFLLPALFLVLAASVRYSGIVRTDIAQRLSLFIPVLAAFLLYNEAPSIFKTFGIALAFTAILLSIPWNTTQNNQSAFGWISLIGVFLGLGIIDILFKQIAQYKTVNFPTSLLVIFIIAFLISLITLLFLFLIKKIKFEWINFGCGLILGMANFGNILFYVKAHQSLATQPSVVFATMNIGVIILGSLVGIVLFKEKLSRLNYVGILLALVSIVFVVLSRK
ncbi:MAG: DMT family transporter [Flavobacterium sp.]|nr:DMT family transporter [Pedobacter sp.]